MEIKPCYKCGANILIAPSECGKGTGELTLYYAECNKCGLFINYLGNNGTKRSAISHYNREAREYEKK
jgi:hypothetical protein